MDGIFNINKPADMTSFGVVARVKRFSGERHIGHAGTLDPLATGVLPVCLGQATRVIEYIFDETKVYRTDVELGKSTDTYDSTGQVTRLADISGIERETVEGALVNFRGSIRQTPPMYSALKHRGMPLYRLARSGIEVERKSRPAQVHSLEIIAWQPPVVTLDIVCGKGTYVRSLAHDLGEMLGCGANMKSLSRLKVGPFNITDAITLPQLEKIFQDGQGYKYLYPLDFVLLPFSAMVVNMEQQGSLIHGLPVAFETTAEARISAVSSDQYCRVYTADGRFLGMVKYDTENKLWRPEKIFFKGCSD